MELDLIEHHPQRVLEDFRRGEFDQIEIIGEADEKEFFELCFHEHNHPVEYDKLSPEERKKAHRERCYKWVSLLHVRGGCHVYAGVSVVPGNAHEAPVLFRLVEQFVQTVGKGVMKLLILDRGFIDGKNLSRCKAQWEIDVLIPLKRKMDLWTDAWALAGREPWQVVPVAVPPPRPPPAHRPEDVRRREQKRQATLAARKPAPDPVTVQTQTEYCALSGFTSWSEATVPLNVLLMRDRYADGHAEEWALISTRSYSHVQQPPHDYRLRTDIEERHRQLKCFYDLTRFASRQFSAIMAQVVMVLLSYTLRQWQLWKHHQEALAGRSPEAIHRRLNLRKQYVVIYHQRAYTELTLVQFTREVLELEPEARAKALAKIQQLEQSMLHPEPEPWTVNRPRRSLMDSS